MYPLQLSSMITMGTPSLRLAAIWASFFLPPFCSADTHQLSPGVSRSIYLTPQGRASFTITLSPGTAAHVRVEQLEGDLAEVIIGPAGSRREVDQFDFGPEDLTVDAIVGGEYQIDVAPSVRYAGQAKGSIVLLSVTPRRPDDDRAKVAEDLATRSKRSVHDGTTLTDAVALAKNSMEAWRQLQDVLSVARSRLRLGDVLLSHNDDRSARDSFREARASCAAASDLRCEAEAANNVGLAALRLTDVDEALQQFAYASGAWKQLGMSFGEAVTRSNLGLLHWQSSEWQQALDEYRKASLLFQRANPLSAARVTNNLGLVYLSMAEHERAASCFLQALAIARKANASQRDIGRFRLNLGRAQMLAGHLRAALRQEQAALRILQAAKDIGGVADVHNNIAQILLRMNQFSAAETSIRAALALYKDLGNQRGLSSALHYLGVLAAASGDLEEARRRLEEALSIRNERRLHDQRAETLYQLAVVENQEGKIDDAERHAGQAIDVVESLRTNVESEALRRSYFADKQAYGEFLIGMLMSHRASSEHDTLAKRAFSVAERLRARTLIEGMSCSPLVVPFDNPKLAAQLRSVRRRLNFKSAQLAVRPKPDPVSDALLRREIDELLAEDEELGVRARNVNSKCDALAAPSLGVDEAQRLLGAHDLLVEYSLGERRSYVWIIGQNSFQTRELAPRSRIEARARAIIDQMENAQERKAYPLKRVEFLVAIRQLAEALGLPFGTTEAGSRILVVPDGILHRAPFAALPGDGSRPSSYPQNAMGMRWELVQAPSASVFLLLQERRRIAGRMPIRVTALVDPVFDATDARLAGQPLPEAVPKPVLKGGPGFGLARLPFADEELAPILRHVPPDRRTVLRGFQSTRKAFLDQRLWQSSHVLASTHAFVDDIQPELSAIVFSMMGKRGTAIDGMVRLYEIYDLPVASSLVVLSACETARGRQVRGEGLVSISRAFLFAGASALLAPLNRVDAESSAALVAAFLDNVLNRGAVPPSTALLRARIRIGQSTRWQDPYYWSSFVLVSGLD
ncbi:CHAT domain-containing protein [Paludibaculum fermentans]|uniref:CHAT domain-containing protein n=1 Tax=Paludibaculum fermentans TaxID=1473598 RepID=UPI003EBDC591